MSKDDTSLLLHLHTYINKIHNTMTTTKTQKKSVHLSTKELLKKWGHILDVQGEPVLKDFLRRRVVAHMLENTANYVKEKLLIQKKFEYQSTGGSLPEDFDEESIDTDGAEFDPLLLSLIRTSFPQLPVYDLCGVQPISGSTGLVFSLRMDYSDDDQAPANKDIYDCEKALFDLEDSDSNLDVAFDSSVGYTMDTLNACALSQHLKVDYSRELHMTDEGMQTIYELVNDELIKTTTRAVLRAIYVSAERGGGDGTVDVSKDIRWQKEKYDNLYRHIQRDIIAIGRRTQRGNGNILICSKDVAVGLSSGGFLQEDFGALDACSYPTEQYDMCVGYLKGDDKVKVFVDKQMGSEDEGFYVVGYKGNRECDAGLIYSPYIPVEIMTAINEHNFQPTMAFTTRYALTFNPLMATDYDGDNEKDVKFRNNNRYYRKVVVKGLGVENCKQEQKKDLDGKAFLREREKDLKDLKINLEEDVENKKTYQMTKALGDSCHLKSEYTKVKEEYEQLQKDFVTLKSEYDQKFKEYREAERRFRDSLK